MTLQRGQGGQTLVGLVVTMAIMGLLIGLGSAGLAPAARGRGVESAARVLAGRFRALALAARSDGRDRALVFPRESRGDEPLQEVADGGGDGIHRTDMEAGKEDAGPPFSLARDLPGTRIGRPDWPTILDLPPAIGPAPRSTPAVRFGTARMVVFKPDGRATPGTVYITDGRQAVCAVVVHGATGRIRIWCLNAGEAAWRLL